MRRCVFAVAVLLLADGISTAITASERLAYEKAVVSAVGGRPIPIVFEDGSQSYMANVAPQTFVGKWCGVVYAHPPGEVVGTRVIVPWKRDDLCDQAGLFDGHTATFATKDGSTYDVTVFGMNKFEVACLFYFYWHGSGAIRPSVTVAAVKVVSRSDAYLIGRMLLTTGGVTLRLSGVRRIFNVKDPNVSPDGAMIVVFRELDPNLYPEIKRQGLKVGRAYLQVAPGWYEDRGKVDLKLSDASIAAKFGVLL